MPIDMTDILHKLRKDPPPRPAPDFGPGPLPDTYLIPAAQLDDLLRDHERLERLAAFLRISETSLCTVHDGDMPNQPEAERDEDHWNTRRWVIGYTIETEHRGCQRFEQLPLAAISGPRWTPASQHGTCRPRAGLSSRRL